MTDTTSETLATLRGLRDPEPRPAHARPMWFDTWLRMAVALADRAECTRARVGCIVVLRNEGVWVGYNGAPSGDRHCTAGGCPRSRSNHAEGEGDPSYSDCIALHAEVNALLKAGLSARGSCLYVTRRPCKPCLKVIRAAGVGRVFWYDDAGLVRFGEPSELQRHPDGRLLTRGDDV